MKRIKKNHGTYKYENACKYKHRLRIAAAVCAALGWWGLLYPGLTLTPDTVNVIRAENSGNTLEDRNTCDGRLYLELLRAERGDIRFRSRLLESLNAFWEAFSWEKSTRD